jgi:hypothetical protein
MLNASRINHCMGPDGDGGLLACNEPGDRDEFDKAAK